MVSQSLQSEDSESNEIAFFDENSKPALGAKTQMNETGS
jgi:hypothetical protein